MANTGFYKNLGPHKLSTIIEFLKGDIVSVMPESYADRLIYDIKPLSAASSNDISFLNNKKYLGDLCITKASACIVPSDHEVQGDDERVILKAKDSYLAYSKLTHLFYDRKKTYPNKIMRSAHIADSAVLGENCYIGHNVVIEENVRIGDDCIIESGSIIDQGVVIGSKALIYQNVVISYAVVGDDIVIFSGTKIGQDGFGFATANGVYHKIFHTGIVQIGNNVEIGANTTIDRGAMSDTIIEDWCRIDNLVQIGHNVKIGKGSIIVAQVGIAGSSVIGEYCALGGQVGVAGHITIGDNVHVSGQGGVIQNIESGSIVGGTPTVPIRDWHKQSVIMKRLVHPSGGVVSRVMTKESKE